jgi:hypothetical protein
VEEELDLEKLEKKTITFQFEHKQLLDFKKLLFRKGLNPQTFFSYIIERVNLCDEHMDELCEGAIQYKLDRALERKSETTDADTLYSLIERQLKNTS